MKSIFDSIALGKLKLKNRLVRSATWEAMALPDGSPSDEQIAVYRDLAEGGVGLIITGFTSVSDNDDNLDGMARLSSDTQIARWKQLVDVCHAKDVPVISQLALGEYTVNGVNKEPDQLTPGDIQRLIDLFRDAAVRAEKAGFDGVQIHLAHNFYLSRFISPAYNHRMDKYGGSASRRANLPIEIMAAIRTAAPSLHISTKINASDFFPGGLTVDDFTATSLLLADAGIESIEVSGNGTSVPGVRAGKDEGYFLPYAQALRMLTNVPIILVGGHRSVEGMNEILNRTSIELLSLSRPLIREPNLPARWAAGDEAPALCVSCNACYRTPGHRCIFNIRKN